MKKITAEYISLDNWPNYRNVILDYFRHISGHDRTLEYCEECEILSLKMNAEFKKTQKPKSPIDIF